MSELPPIPTRKPDFVDTFPDGFRAHYYKTDTGHWETRLFDCEGTYIGAPQTPWSSLGVARNNSHWCYQSRMGRGHKVPKGF